MDSLENIRSQIDLLDQKLIVLLEQRLKLVQEASAIKSIDKLKVFEQDREDFLLADRKDYALKHNVPTALVTDIFKRILRESYKQELSNFAKTTTDSRPITIVGGRGAMGSLFHKLLLHCDYSVNIIDRDNFDQAALLVKDVQAVIICVPIDVTVLVIQQIAPFLAKDTVLCDFTSTKTHIVEAMLKYHQGPVVGYHPMFGPDTKSLVKQVVVEVKGRYYEQCAFLTKQFEYLGAKIVSCEAKEHDDAMSIIQALRHFTSYYYGVFLKDLHPNLSKLVALSSPIYRLELMMVGRLFAQDPNLYYEIINSSKHNQQLIEQYLAKLTEQVKLIKDYKKEDFIANFYKVREFFGELAPIFLQESASLLAKFQDDR